MHPAGGPLPACGLLDIQTLRQVCRCAGVPVCRCAGVVPVCRCAGVPVCRCAGVPVCRCAGVPVCRCAGVPVCRCAGVPVCRCAGVPVCRCAGVPVCRCAGVPVCRDFIALRSSVVVPFPGTVIPVATGLAGTVSRQRTANPCDFAMSSSAATGSLPLLTSNLAIDHRLCR